MAAKITISWHLYQQFIAEAPAGTIRVKIIQIQGSPCAITFKRKPTTMSWSRCCFKKNHVSYVLQINTNIKFALKYTLFSTQHVLITSWGKGTTRCIEERNGDEYKNITTRNCCPSWTSQLLRWHYKPTAAIRLLYPSGLSANYNRCPWWTCGNGVIHPVWTVAPNTACKFLK
jgi:hypothetical protein